MSKIRIQQTHSFLTFFQRVVDALTIGGSLYLSQWLAGQYTSDRTPITILVAVLAYFLVSEACNLYRPGKTRSANWDLALVIASWMFTVLLLAALAFFTREGIAFARSSILGWIFVSGASLGFVRMLSHIAASWANAAGWTSKQCAIAGMNPLGIQLAQNANRCPSLGLDVVGFFDDRRKDRWQAAAEKDSEYLGKLDSLVEMAREGKIDTVFITLPMRAEKRIRWLLDQLADTTASAYIVPDFFVFEMLHSRWSSIGGLPAVSVFESPVYGVDGWLKRSFDVAIATAALFLLSPVMVACALAVKFSSPGPIFFRQKRYGLDGREIMVWKFRSMTTCDNGDKVKQATKGDQRITRIGAILRKTSLDELPQLLNVLDGTMSLVGPRPHASAHNEHYRKLIRGYMLRHKVRPGITGLAQVEGFRGETETLDKMQKRIEFDHRYIQQWSIWLDFKILLKTAFVVFKQENAY
ncbi:MAG: undecaprenyl-phosphate glucose phosphotransferase [Aureliella sp.]